MAILRHFSRFVDRCNQGLLQLAGWICIALILVTVEQVIARYFFDASSIALQELEWHLFALVFLLTGAITYARDEHVRVDVFYCRLGKRQQDWINIFGIIFLAIPTCAVLIWTGIEFATQALSYDTPQAEGDAGFIQQMTNLLLTGEASPDPGGLRGRWLLKAMLPLSAGFLLLQSMSELSRLLPAVLTGRSRPRKDHAPAEKS